MTAGAKAPEFECDERGRQATVSQLVFRPSGAEFCSILLPTACAVGFILALLRSFEPSLVPLFVPAFSCDTVSQGPVFQREGWKRMINGRLEADHRQIRLEAELGLQFDFAVGGGAGERASGKRDGLSEILRTQHSDGSGGVHFVQDVARVDAEGEAVALGGRGTAEAAGAPAKADTAATASATTTATRATWTAGAAAGTARLRSTFSNLRAEADCFREAEVERELGRAGEIVDGDLIAGAGWDDIVAAGGRRRERAGTDRIGAERGPDVEL